MQLKSKYHDISISIAGEISSKNGYGKYIRNLVKMSRLNIKLLGGINASQLADEMVE